MSLSPVNENDFQDTVIKLAKLHGWRVAHFRPSRTKDGWATAVSADGKGFPDLFMLRDSTGHRVAAELKVGHNKTTPEQDAWLTAMEACGIPAFVWKPCDWDEIEDVLTNGVK